MRESKSGRRWWWVLGNTMTQVRTTYKCKRPMTWARWRSTLDSRGGVSRNIQTLVSEPRDTTEFSWYGVSRSRFLLIGWEGRENFKMERKEQRRRVVCTRLTWRRWGESLPLSYLPIRKNVVRGCPGEHVWDESWNWCRVGTLTTSFDQYHQHLFWWGCRMQIHPQ